MHFLQTPFKERPLGVPLSADFYFRNGLRILGVPADVSTAELDLHATRLKGKLELNPAVAARAGIDLGYHLPIDAKSVLSSLKHLTDPKALLLSEIFWLNQGGAASEWAQIQAGRTLGKTNLERLRTAARTGSEPRAAHALAVLLHNQAIAADCTYAASGDGAQPAAPPLWSEALHWWGEVIKSKWFWTGLSDRVRAINHINLRLEHLDELRRQLPAVILAFNETFARHYALARNGGGRFLHLNALQAHLECVSGCRFDGKQKHRSLSAMAGEVIQNQLITAASAFDTALAEHDGFFDLAKFRATADPLLASLEAAYDLCRQQFSLGTSVFEWCTFDAYCDRLHKALNQRIEWVGEDGLWERKIYYGALVFERMLALPLSPTLREAIHSDRDKHLEHLWGSGAADVKESGRWKQCYFVSGQPSDVDSLLLIPHYRVVEEDMFAVKRWRKRSFVVPRSTAGSKVHSGRTKAAALLEDLKKDPALKTKAAEIEHERERGLAAIAARRDAEQAKLQRERDAVAKERDAATLRFAPAQKRYDTEIRKAATLRDARVRQADQDYQVAKTKAQGAHDARELELSQAPLLLRIFGFWSIRRKRAQAAQEYERTMDEAARVRDSRQRQAHVDFEGESSRLSNELSVERRRVGLEAAETRLQGIDQTLKSSSSRYEEEVRKYQATVEEKKAALIPAVKPQTDWKQFPAYRKFQGDGFKEGSEPPPKHVDIELEMNRLMNRLSPVDRMLLAEIVRRNPDAGFAVVQVLLENPGLTVMDVLNRLGRR